MPGRILFIDDDPAGREVALFNLRKAGYETIPAADGREGLSLFSASPFDLVITDLKMPGISGMEVLRKVRAGSPDVPVLVITAFGNVETAVAAMKEGAYDFIGKPFHRDQLLLAVSKALERRRLPPGGGDPRVRAPRGGGGGGRPSRGPGATAPGGFARRRAGRSFSTRWPRSLRRCRGSCFGRSRRGWWMR